jgi:hypothetical protein
LGALWDILQFKLVADGLLSGVQGCLLDKDADVRCEAARVMGEFGPAAAGSVPRLIEMLRADLPEVRAVVALVLGQIGGDGEGVVPWLILSLRDQASQVAIAAAGAISRFGRAAGSAEAEILADMRRVAFDDGLRFVSLVAALREVSPDAEARMEEWLTGPDRELLDYALSILDELSK